MKRARLAGEMTTQAPARPVADGITERFDPIACVDERARHRAVSLDPVEPGRYIEIQGADQTLLIPLPSEVTHIGRGLSAGLRLDDDLSIAPPRDPRSALVRARGSSTTAAPTARS